MNGKKLVILDLNGILISRVFSRHMSAEEEEVLSNYGKAEDRMVNHEHSHLWKRPYLDEFLEMLFERYTVAVWTTMFVHHVKYIIPWVFGKYKKQLLFVYTQSDCWSLNDGESSKPFFAKLLYNVWQRYGECDTVLLDDSPRKCIFNPPGTLFSPASWDYTMQDDTALSLTGAIYQFFARESTPVDNPHRSKEFRKLAKKYVGMLQLY